MHRDARGAVDSFVSDEVDEREEGSELDLAVALVGLHGVEDHADAPPLQQHSLVVWVQSHVHQRPATPGYRQGGQGRARREGQNNGTERVSWALCPIRLTGIRD